MKLPSENFYSLSVVKIREGWQASIRKTSDAGFSIRVAATAQEAIDQCFGAPAKRAEPDPWD